MKPTADTKKPPGRPRKPEKERLEQFSVRLPPKLKFGLDLLARAQHRSLSQSVEWALQVGLNSYVVGKEEETVGSVLDAAWSAATPLTRAMQIYMHAPSLLSFEDLAMCEVIERSSERAQIYEHTASENGVAAEKKFESRNRDDSAALEELQDLEDDEYGVLIQFAEHFCKEIREKAIEIANSGRSTQDVCLIHLLGKAGKVGRGGPKRCVDRMRELLSESTADAEK